MGHGLMVFCFQKNLYHRTIRTLLLKRIPITWYCGNEWMHDDKNTGLVQTRLFHYEAHSSGIKSYNLRSMISRKYRNVSLIDE